MDKYPGRLLVIILLSCLPVLAAAGVPVLPGPVGLAGKSVVSVSLRARDGEVLASGTGFIVSEQGIVATGYATVALWQEPANRLFLQTADGTQLVAEQVVAADAAQGLALLRTTGTALPALRLQPDFAFKRDSPCYVVGGPSDQLPVLLQGKISRVLPGGEALKVDARLRPESTGAPVLNRLGEVVAMVVSAPGKSPDEGSAVSLAAASGAAVPATAVSGAAVKKMLEAYRDSLLSRAWFELGLLYDAEKDRSADAAAAFREATRLAPDYIEAYNNLSVIYGRAGKYEDAAGVLQKVLDLKPDFAEANFNLGIAYTRLGRYPDAVAAFRRLLAARPRDADARYLMAIALLRLKDYEAARQEQEILSGLNSALSGKLGKLLDSGKDPAATRD